MAWRSKRKVMHAYDVTAEIYDERYCEEQERKYHEALDTVPVEGKKVIDVGCGSGLFFPQISSQAQLVVGIDVSKGLLLKAKQYQTATVHLIQADADHIPIHEGIFDLAFSFTVLQNMPKPSKTLAEIKRIVRRGGKIAVTGLKKAFPDLSFHDLVENGGMQLAEFIDREEINCYIAILTR